MDVTCFNAVYDMNGNKGPNTVGKDIGFVGALYNGYETKSVAVLPYNKEMYVGDLNVDNQNYFKAASDFCNSIDNENNWILPDINELTLLYINKNISTIIEITTDEWFWSRTPVAISGHSFTHFHQLNFASTSSRYWAKYNNSKGHVRCIRNSLIK